MLGSKGSDTKSAVRSATGGTGAGAPRAPRLSRRPRVPRARTPRRQVAVMTGLAFAVLLLLVGIVFLAGSMIKGVTDDEPSDLSQIVNSAATPSTTPAAEPAGCPVTPGDQSSSEAAIAAFEHAYYTLRSADAVIAVMAPGAVSYSPPEMQAGIDSIPAGTTYCMTVTGVSPGTYALELTETRPVGKGLSLRQLITTAEIDGRHFITSITDAEGI